MAIKDILVHLDTYPDPTPVAEIDAAIAFAAAAGAKLTAMAFGVTIPLKSNRIADYLIGMSKMVAEVEGRSAAAAQKLTAEFTQRARRARVFGRAMVRRLDDYRAPDVLAREARTRDLCLLPLGGRYSGQREAAQAVIFESGRPALIYGGHGKPFANGLKKVVIAWDGGACAARAVAEALPLLARVAEVRVLTVKGEKPSVRAGLADDLIRHLAAHRIAAEADEVDAKGRGIGQVIDAYLRRQKPDLLVMGAFGRSRLREFILGGATEHVLWETRVPTLLSH